MYFEVWVFKGWISHLKLYVFYCGRSNKKLRWAGCYRLRQFRLLYEQTVCHWILGNKAEQCKRSPSGDLFDGKEQFECLNNKGVLLEFGEIPTRLRREVRKFSEQCWTFKPEDKPCDDNEIENSLWEECYKTGRDLKQVIN